MTPAKFLSYVLDPALYFLQSISAVPAVTDEARVFLLAVAGQEANWTARYQNSPSASPGMARGFWQFEQTGGVTGVVTHKNSRDAAAAVCAALGIVCAPEAIWRALEGNDLLAGSFARLLLWTDPYAIPTTQQTAWECYNDRLWQPGKPHPETWPTCWNEAFDAVYYEAVA